MFIVFVCEAEFSHNFINKITKTEENCNDDDQWVLLLLFFFFFLPAKKYAFLTVHKNTPDHISQFEETCC